MKKKKSYIKSLDGLRALAILLVIGYHFRMPLFKGGFIGVDMFFVLSGYLITGQLLYKLSHKEILSLKEFWIKRVKRLYPAVVALMLLVTLFVFVKSPTNIQSVLTDDLAGIFGVSNWWYIVKKVPYADTFANPAPLKHLWSLAVEAQFYLLLPLLFIGDNNSPTKKKSRAFILLLAVILSVISMMCWYSPGDINRAYYGTDSRIFTLLMGSLLAFIYPYNRLKVTMPKKMTRSFDGVGTLMLVIIGIFVLMGNEYQPFLYQGGFLLITLASTLILAVVIHPATTLNRLFSHSLLRWIGMRSYSLYLWHYPIIVLTTPMKIAGVYHWTLMFFQTILMFVLAEMSYKYIETPIRKYSGNWFKSVNHAIKESKTKIIELILIGITILGMVFTVTFFNQMVDRSSTLSTENVSKKTDKKPSEKETTIKKVPIKHIYMIGDSVLLGSKSNIEAILPQASVDGEVGRQFIDLPDLLKKQYANKFNQETLVLVSLGTNGPFEEKDLANLYQQITTTGAHLALMNTYVPLNWQDQVNRVIDSFANKHQEVHVIDWHSYIADKLAYLENDGVHPTVEGRDLLANLIKEDLEKQFIFDDKK
ncbi:acyltransferase family protein [Vagococcus xieshaowenii]|uniref:Acyltransferase n=1 Tax=Vagococcus xieshaowenii TaxID=2562451 RepID=A0AAJ5EEK6_9ENTE|nr:acyltransferase family protein [Vagococcus xieshaowenii]QCA28689.1 acyltransferase [Vagococcus xieshaowenii]TFZ40503.1 acyltransferase [Vagococcus xieshaowenii]